MSSINKVSRHEFVLSRILHFFYNFEVCRKLCEGNAVKYKWILFRTPTCICAKFYFLPITIAIKYGVIAKTLALPSACN